MLLLGGFSAYSSVWCSFTSLLGSISCWSVLFVTCPLSSFSESLAFCCEGSIGRHLTLPCTKWWSKKLRDSLELVSQSKRCTLFLAHYVVLMARDSCFATAIPEYEGCAWHGSLNGRMICKILISRNISRWQFPFSEFHSLQIFSSRAEKGIDRYSLHAAALTWYQPGASIIPRLGAEFQGKKNWFLRPWQGLWADGGSSMHRHSDDLLANYGRKYVFFSLELVRYGVVE